MIRGSGASVVVLSAALLSLLLGGCREGPPADRDSASAVRVLSQPYLTYAALRVAEAEGYFAEQGLDVELVSASSSEDAVPLLVSGAIDVLPGHLSPGIITSIARGHPVRAVATTAVSSSSACSSIGILRRPDLPVRAGAAVPVRRISINRQAAMIFIVERMLEHVGLDLAELKAVYLPHAVEPEALAGGEIDAALAGEPFMTRTILAGKGALWIPIEDPLPGFQYSFLFYGKRLLERDRDVGARFAVAYLKATRKLAEGATATNVDLVGRLTGESPDHLRRMCWPFNPTDGRVDLESVRVFQNWLLKKDLIRGSVEEARLWDPWFVDQANRVLSNRLEEP